MGSEAANLFYHEAQLQTADRWLTAQKCPILTLGNDVIVLGLTYT